MRVFWFLFLLFLAGMPASAQTKSDLWISFRDDKGQLEHRVQPGETVFSLGRKYHVPPAILADANNLTYQDGLKTNQIVRIPLGAYNLLSDRPRNVNETRALYYRVQSEDNLYRISRQMHISREALEEWNQLGGDAVSAGQSLLVGWVLYDETPFQAVPGVAPPNSYVSQNRVPGSGLQSSASGKPAVQPKPVTAVPKVIYDTPKIHVNPPPADTVQTDPDARPAPAPNSLEAEYNAQTQDGLNLVTERGAAAFYALTSKAKGAGAYAFHNSAARGAVIRVRNLNNGRYVFVKVLGPLPMTKQYVNCIIGLSNAAKAALNVRDSKAFCELTYGGY